MTDWLSSRNLAEMGTIALDGGTTNTRARLMKGGRVLATARRAVGVRDTVLGDPQASSPAEVAATEATPVEAAPKPKRRTTKKDATTPQLEPAAATGARPRKLIQLPLEIE